VKRRLRRALLLLALLVLSLPLLALAVLGSERGSAWVIAQAVQAMQAEGRELGLARSEGSLLGRLQLHGVRYAEAGVELEAQRLLLHWRPAALWEGQLLLQQIELDGARLQLPPGGDEAPQAPAIPDIVLPLPVALRQLTLSDVSIVSGADSWHIQQASLGAAADPQELVVERLQLQGSGLQLQGELRMQARAPHALQGRLEAVLSEQLTQIGQTRAQLQLSGPALRPRLQLQLFEPAEAQLQGGLDLRQVQPAFDLQATWQSLGWPLDTTPQYLLQQGSLGLQGTVENYRLQLQAQAQIEQLPATAVKLQGKGNLQGLTLAPLQLSAASGKLSLEGRIGWDGPLSWDVQAQASRLDPGLYLPDWPGEVNGGLRSKGQYRSADGALQLDLDIDQLHGSLREQPLAMDGRLALQQGRWRAEKLHLRSGENRLQLDGQVGDALGLAFSIDAPQLEALYPGLYGRLLAAGRIEGTPESPQLAARVDGSAIAYQDLRLASVGADIDWREQGGKAKVSASGLALAGEQFASLDVDLHGTPQQHELGVQLQGDGLGLALQAAGSLEENAWQGRLNALSLHEALLGRWQLRESVEVSASAEQVRTARLCLQQAQALLCSEGGWSGAGGLDLQGSLQDLPLALLNPLLPQARIDGLLAGQFSVRGDPAQPQAQLQLQPGDGRLLIGIDEPEPLQLPYRDARLDARFADDRGSAELKLRLEPGGQAAANIRLGAQRAGDRSLQGQLQADFPDLALVEGFVPELRKVQGRLRLDAQLAGSLAAPDMRGGLHIEQGSAELPLAGLELQDIALSLSGDGTGPLRVQGQASSGEGKLELSGSVRPQPAGPRLDLRLQGEDFLAYRTPDAQVWISPDLQLQGTRPLRLSGLLRVPRAEVKVKSLPGSSVSLSDDTLIVGETEASEPPGRAIDAQLRVELGDKVSFEGFGLETRLQGALDARVDSAGQHVEGKIELVEGSYQAYGQDLTVERGRLLFSGVPGNPDVDLRALRTSRDGRVKAYLALDGPLRKPRPRVFSEPALPDAEALAYLLTGNGLDAADRQQGLDIAGAALSLGLARGEPLLLQMSERLGLDELRVESGDQGVQDSALVLGKYLNPDLYLGYSQGLFNPEGALLLRLRLNDRLDLESRSGAEQSVDLFYRREHD